MPSAAGLGSDRVPPEWLIHGTEVTYRSGMLGLWGIGVRWGNMPLERLALIANSSAVDAMPVASSKKKAPTSDLLRAAQLVVKDGWLAPWRVVSARSCIAWFLQYSIMGAAFQGVDRMLSKTLGVQPCFYGDELFELDDEDEQNSIRSKFNTSQGSDSEAIIQTIYLTKVYSKALLAPILAGAIESLVSNKAEVERFYGKEEFKRIVTSSRATRGPLSTLSNIAGPAFWANATRNAVMSYATFIGTPLLFITFMPAENRNPQTLAWSGLLGNLLANVFGTTCQAAWGRSLDFLAREGRIAYRDTIYEGLQSTGVGAFINPTKWITRVGMNFVPQGMIPWYWNTIIPLGEGHVKHLVYSVWIATVSV